MSKVYQRDKLDINSQSVLGDTINDKNSHSFDLKLFDFCLQKIGMFEIIQSMCILTTFFKILFLLDWDSLSPWRDWTTRNLRSPRGWPTPSSSPPREPLNRCTPPALQRSPPAPQSPQ